MYGKYLKEQRKIQGYTMKQIEQATGITQQNISRWERDEVEPQIHFCVQLADFYGISLDELIGRDTHYTEHDTYAQNNVHSNNTMHVTKNCSK